MPGPAALTGTRAQPVCTGFVGIGDVDEADALLVVRLGDDVAADGEPVRRAVADRGRADGAVELAGLAGRT